MSHLTRERLAALADETPTPIEAAHITTCDACTSEISAHRRLTRLAVAAGVTSIAPISRFDTLASRLAAEGLLHRPDRREAMRRLVMRIAAAFVLVTGGVLAGRLSAGGSVGGFALTRSAAPEAGQPGIAQQVSSYRTPDDAMKALTTAQQTYQNAAAFLAAQDTSAHFIGLNQDSYRTRLQALDDIAAATRVALYRAPQDPVLNQYYLGTLSAREATLNQMQLASGGTRTLRTY